MRRLEGKVAFITGAARGQGRSHAIRMAEEGADIIALDLCGQVPTVHYDLATEEDLHQTVRAVEALDRRIVAQVGDVRDPAALDTVIKDGVERLGRLDIVVPNHGITGAGAVAQLSEDEWRDMIDINLTGVWRTIKAALPSIIKGGRGGAIVMTSSLAGKRGVPNISHYVAAKAGILGLMRSLATELGPQRIRVNAVLPGNVRTPMVLNSVMYKLYRPDLKDPQLEDILDINRNMSPLGVDFLEPRDISNAILWLASDEARYVTGLGMSVDGGWANK